MQGRDATATLTTPGGADVTISVSQIDVANDETQDPRLFEDDYDVASATGFRVWEASSLFVALLRQRSVQQQFAGRCVLELGSGTGFLAMAAASIGAHVLATDTRTVTVESIRPNIERNCMPSQALVAVAGFAVEGHRRLGAGSVAAAALDWHADARLQLSAAGVASNFTFDIILAADCIWLLDVARPFADTLCSLMPPGCPTIAVLCFQNRAHDNSTTFVKLDQVAAALVAFACVPPLLSARIRRWSVRRSHAAPGAANALQSRTSHQSKRTAQRSLACSLIHPCSFCVRRSRSSCPTTTSFSTLSPRFQSRSQHSNSFPPTSTPHPSHEQQTHRLPPKPLNQRAAAVVLLPAAALRLLSSDSVVKRSGDHAVCFSLGGGAWLWNQQSSISNLLDRKYLQHGSAPAF